MAGGRPKGSPKLAGRVKGTPNRATSEIIEKLDRLKCDPITGMARLAMGDVPCPECKGKGKQKYAFNGTDLVRRPDGNELTCLMCLGDKKEPIKQEIRAKMYSELARYVYPQRKAVEHTGADGAPQIQVVIKKSWED